MRRIGVFDSGMGGLSVATAIKKELPDDEVIFMNDTDHVPYGDKNPKELLAFVVPVLEELVLKECEAIVIACNTVTTTLIQKLQKIIPVPIVGVEPMVKEAVSISKTGVIAVCATPTTLASPRYKWLKETYAQNTITLQPDCSDWAFMIENDQVDRHKIFARINEACKMEADVIVLGCTHYHWIEDLIKESAGNRAKVLQPEEATVAKLKQTLASLEKKQRG